MLATALQQSGRELVASVDSQRRFGKARQRAAKARNASTSAAEPCTGLAEKKSVPQARLMIAFLANKVINAALTIAQNDRRLLGRSDFGAAPERGAERTGLWP